MVDPDAPSRKNPRAAQWLHWILTNVDGEEEKTEDDCVPLTLSGERLLSGKDLAGKEVTAYAGPSPPKG